MPREVKMLHGKASHPAAVKSTALPDLRRWLSAASGMVRVVNSSAPVEELLSNVAQTARLLLDLDMCAVMLYEESRQRLTICGHDGLSADYVEQLNNSRPVIVAQDDGVYTSPAAKAFVTGATIAIEDVHSSSDFVHWRDLARGEGYSAIVATPLVADARRVGVIVGYSQASREFTSTHVELLQLLADHAGVALQTARLRSSAQEMIEQLNAANAALLLQRQALEAAQDQHRRLMQVMANDVGVAGVVTMLAELLQASVTVEDPQGHVVATAAVGTYLAPPSAKERELEPLHATLGRVLRERVGAVQVQGPRSSSSRFWVAPVTLGDDVVAMLWVSHPRAGVADVDLRGIERFALVLALEMAKQRTRLQAHIGVSRDLVVDLLTDVRETHVKDLYARSEALGHDLAVPQVVIVAAPDPVRGPGVSRPLDVARLIELAIAVARQHGCDALVGSLDQHVIVLVSSPDGSRRAALNFASDLQKSVSASRKGGTVSLVVGTSTQTPGGITDAFTAARGALRIAMRARFDSLVDLEEFGMYSLLFTNPNPEPLIHFSERLLAPLSNRDIKKQGDLITTLRTWFDCNCSTSATSELLVVHPNTVIYRLRVIEDLLGKSLKDQSFLGELRLALMALDITGGKRD
jgi:sugar diacid utilization regulator